MRIVTYDLEKDENDMPMLVKESSQNCPSISNSITDPGEAVEIQPGFLHVYYCVGQHILLLHITIRVVMYLHLRKTKR